MDTISNHPSETGNYLHYGYGTTTTKSQLIQSTQTRKTNTMKLNAIQQQLKAPKGQTNNFGKYKYRSCEDILEAVKPHLGDCSLIVSDDITVHADRVYVKATATLVDENGHAIASATGLAREPQTKKGMDESQITGAASSYARKYALNGLFAIDDTKDADFSNTGGGAPKQVASSKITNTQKSAVVGLIEKAAFTPEQGIKAIRWASGNRTEKLDELSTVEAGTLIKFVEGKLA
jgi:hypothetical protein